MTTLYLALLLVVSSAALGYSAYVGTLVMRADFYSRGQKVARCMIAWLLPLLGTGLVHMVYNSHRASPKNPHG